MGASAKAKNPRKCPACNWGRVEVRWAQPWYRLFAWTPYLVCPSEPCGYYRSLGRDDVAPVEG